MQKLFSGHTEKTNIMTWQHKANHCETSWDIPSNNKNLPGWFHAFIITLPGLWPGKVDVLYVVSALPAFHIQTASIGHKYFLFFLLDSSLHWRVVAAAGRVAYHCCSCIPAKWDGASIRLKYYKMHTPQSGKQSRLSIT